MTVEEFLEFHNQEPAGRDRRNRSSPEQDKDAPRVREPAVEKCCAHNHKQPDADEPYDGEELVAQVRIAPRAIHPPRLEDGEPHRYEDDRTGDVAREGRHSARDLKNRCEGRIKTEPI